MAINPYLIGHARYEVIASAVVARSTSGAETYIYRGGILPPGTVYIDHLLNAGLIRKIEEPTS